MGLLSKVRRWRRWLPGIEDPGLIAPRRSAQALRLCQVEELEPRQLRAADLHLGAVYFEEASGDDSAGDRIHVTFQGGAPGAQLTRLTIDGDKLKDGGVTLGDVFFDVSAGGAGKFKSVPLSIVSHDGFSITRVSVADGSSQITFDLAGFDAGETLVFEIDVDEQGLFTSTSVAEGGEFEGSHLTGLFTHQNFEDATLSAIFYDQYDGNFSAAAAQAGSQLSLPPDSYIPPDSVDREDRTAGAVARLRQVPKPITISGTVFHDPNLSNSQDSGELGLSGVSIALLEWNGSSYVATGKTTVTNALGDYRFDGILPGTYRIVETQPSGYLSVGAKPGSIGGATAGVVTSSDILSEITLLGGQDSVENDFAEVRPASISGRVFADPEGDCEFGSADLPLAGVRMELLNSVGAVTATTLTDSQGLYRFENLMPGVYSVREVQPAAYYQGGQKIGSAGGTIAAPDWTSNILLTSGLVGVDYDFCELLPASLSGRVFADPEGDCVFGPQDRPLNGVTIELLNAQGSVVATTTTDPLGDYRFQNLAPGAYSVRELQPAGYFQGAATAGSAGGVVNGDLISQIVLGSAANAVRYDFCEIIPGSISGRVHADPEGDCVFGPNDLPLAGVAVQLRDASGNLLRTTFTNAAGEYLFDNLPPGTYQVRETQPAGYFQGDERVGSAGGVVSATDLITGITITSAKDAVRYDFCELLPATLRGRVHADPEGDCVYGPQDIPLAGVKIELLDATSTVVQTTFTNADGQYAFQNIAPGVYRVRETQPAGYFQGDAMPGSAGGSAISSDLIEGIVLGSAATAVDYDFCEVIPASLAGRVFADPEGDCVFGPQDRPLSGVRIELLNGAGAVVATTTTNSVGDYRFDGLAPGAYAVREVQPAGYYQGGTIVGTAGGIVSAQDLIGQIVLKSATKAERYDFCEQLPASIEGRVHADPEADCVFGPLDVPLAGVAVQLLDSSGNVIRTTFTAADGRYKFDNLAPGTYGVRELQPVGYFQGDEMVGSAGGVVIAPNTIASIQLGSGARAVNYDFCEHLPGSIAGQVHADPEGDCIVGPADIPLAGVTIELLSPTGTVLAATQTNSAGRYQFDGLAPGTYSVREQQPGGYFQGDAMAGSVGGVVIGPDLISQITLTSATRAVNYDFCELPLGAISGYVYQDGPTILVSEGETADPAALRDGVRSAGDAPISGVIVLLGNQNGSPILDASGKPLFAVTDARGYYQFTGLMPTGFTPELEYYTIRQVQPTGYIDWKDSPGSTGGLAVNPRPKSIAGEIDQLDEAISQLGVPANNDAILRVQLPAGQSSLENNFSEIRIEQRPLIVIPQIPPLALRPAVELPLLDLASRRPLANSPAPQPVIPDRIQAASAIGYTWHLSVLNAGQPRSPQDGETLIEADHSRFNVSTWSGADLAQTRWTLVNVDDQPPMRPLFGAEHAIPVSGDFNGDGRSEVGVFLDGEWFIDVNGNGLWDEGDLWAKLGHKDDKPVVGDWDGDGKDDIGIFGPAWAGDPLAIEREPGLPQANNPPQTRAKNLPPHQDEASDGRRTLKLSLQGALRADLIDHVFHYGAPVDVPVSGDWAGAGVDCIGIFKNGRWYLDADGNGRWSKGDIATEFGQPGDIPVVGDWDGNGIDDLGVYRAGKWLLDSNGDRQLDSDDQVIESGDARDKPVAGDWNGDGRDEIGLYHEGQLERTAEAPPSASRQ